MPRYDKALRDPDPNIRLRGFTALYDEMFVCLFKFVRSSFPTLDETAWADASTNALLKIWRMVDSGRHTWVAGTGPRASLNLLFHIARRQACNEYRTVLRQRARLRAVVWDADTELEAAVQQAQEYQRAEGERDRVAGWEKKLQRAVRRLPPQQRRFAEVIYNQAGDKLTTEETCELYQKYYRKKISVAAAKSLKRIVGRKIISALRPNSDSEDRNATPSNRPRAAGRRLGLESRGAGGVQAGERPGGGGGNQGGIEGEAVVGGGCLSPQEGEPLQSPAGQSEGRGGDGREDREGDEKGPSDGAREQIA